MTQFAHTIESHSTSIEKVPYTGKTHTTVAKGRPFMTKWPDRWSSPAGGRARLLRPGGITPV